VKEVLFKNGQKLFDARRKKETYFRGEGGGNKRCGKNQTRGRREAEKKVAGPAQKEKKQLKKLRYEKKSQTGCAAEKRKGGREKGQRNWDAARKREFGSFQTAACRLEGARGCMDPRNQEVQGLGGDR